MQADELCLMEHMQHDIVRVPTNDLPWFALYVGMSVCLCFHIFELHRGTKYANLDYPILV